MDSAAKIALRERTRRRHQSLFVRCDLGGIMSPVTGRQDTLNLLAGAEVENLMAISDETWGIKEYELGKTNELEQFAVAQDRQIADEKVATERAKLAIRIATDAIVLSVLRYDAAVKALLMDAREYAALVELEQLDLERLRAILGVEKEGLRLKEIDAQIFGEQVQRAQADADVQKGEMEVTRAEFAVTKEGLRLKEIGARVIEEEVHRAQVDSDVEKANMDVTRAYHDIDKEKLKQDKVQVEIVTEDVQRAQVDSDIEKTKIGVAKADLAVDKELLRRTQIQGELQEEGARQAQMDGDIAKAELDITKTGLALDKEGLHLKDVNSQIFLESIKQREVEADLAKAQVDIAKANVRAIMADIGASEAEIKVINAQIETVMMEAEKAGLQADVAQIFAQIMVKQLSQVKLSVNQAEISAGFKYITSKINDMLAIWDEKKVIENLKLDLEQALMAELAPYRAAEQTAEDLKETEVLNNLEVFDFTRAETQANISKESALKATLVRARERVSDQRLSNMISQDVKRTWAQELLSVAHKWAYLHSEQWFTKITREYRYIKGD